MGHSTHQMVAISEGYKLQYIFLNPEIKYGLQSAGDLHRFYKGKELTPTTLDCSCGLHTL